MALLPRIRHVKTFQRPRASVTRCFLRSNKRDINAMRMKLFSAVAGGLAIVAGLAGPAHAGLPRDVVLSADSQDADDAMGLTIAQGRAELIAAARAIRGTADVIEVWGKGNKVVFRGKAAVAVGEQRFEGSTVTCALDFYTCAAIDDDVSSASAGIAAIIPE
jgi:hypothetical protein